MTTLAQRRSKGLLDCRLLRLKKIPPGSRPKSHIPFISHMGSDHRQHFCTIFLNYFHTLKVIKNKETTVKKKKTIQPVC